jgi:DHA1 family bicyclomycin/chloramphenicol resistance-like MFS transporter
MLSYMLMVYALAPAIAPILGGWMQVTMGWRAIFYFLGSCGILVLGLCHFALDESLQVHARQRFALMPVLANYAMVVRHRRFMLLALAGASMSIGFALYIGAAASFVMTILHLPETAFGWLCLPLIGGTMLGAGVVARWARRFGTGEMIGVGYLLMIVAAGLNVAYNLMLTPTLPVAVLPLMLYTFGRALATPGLTVLGLDLFPQHRGLASSLQSFVQMLVFALVAGILAPLLYDSGLKLACGMLGGCLVSLWCWIALSGTVHFFKGRQIS